ncbi:hypothetical protein PHYSODRAFT_466745 [Phytophthora sojae]|uniref:Chromo domain-containing protein n=1 Tax=Phytophthora sojae (strain P6497) TaxID=1094619 RepID=G4YI64_PHYSP|nr:hypothetical protein PHYSODRAFT_466745 [Phytophthora sojae]EGZ27075.1 hypothetical protein PHYSODRAFT_466745 [Phytophthora sojae]|eukprot:XP_009514350.1 hypothetical protein PHYSODRAFT_466745 [Phytophthora sojae]
MKLFLPLGFSLDSTIGEYADRVMQAGNTAQKNMHEFLQARGIKRKFGSGLLKQLRALHRDRALDELITRAFIRREFPLAYVTDEALRYLRHELRDQVTEAPSPRGPLFDVLSLLQQQTGRRIEGHHVLAWRSSRRPSLRQLPSTGANASHAAAHDDDDVVWIPAPSGLPVTTDTGSVLNADDGRDDSEASETEWVPTENLAAPRSTAPQLYNIRAITNSYMRNGKRVYLVEWEQTEEPATNLPRNMVAAYNRRRRALVRRTFIEDKAGHGRGRLRNSEPAPERRRRRPLRRLRRALHF